MTDCWNFTLRERPAFAMLVQRWANLMPPKGLKSVSQVSIASGWKREAINTECVEMEEFVSPFFVPEMIRTSDAI
jgi:hypothetical protein